MNQRKITPAAAFVLLTITVGLLLLLPRRPALAPPRPRPWIPRPRPQFSDTEIAHMTRQVQREISLMEHGHVD